MTNDRLSSLTPSELEAFYTHAGKLMNDGAGQFVADQAAWAVVREMQTRERERRRTLNGRGA